MDSKRLKGLPVVAIEGGLKLGTVHDAFLDAERRAIVAFALRQGGGLLSGVVDPPLVAEADDIHSLGHDALTIDSASVMREGIRGKRVDALSLDGLLKRPVVTEGGTSVGQVVNATFDPTTLQLVSIEVSPGFFRSNKVIAERLVTSLGADVVVVDDAVCHPPVQAAELDEGALESEPSI